MTHNLLIDAVQEIVEASTSTRMKKTITQGIGSDNNADKMFTLDSLNQHNNLYNINPVNQSKLGQLAKHYNITTNGMLDKLINDAKVPKIKPVVLNKLKKLVIPNNIKNYHQLNDYLLTNYTNEGSILFNTIAADVWAKEFVKLYPQIDEDVILEWFSNFNNSSLF